LEFRIFPLSSFVTYKYNLNEHEICNFYIVEESSRCRSMSDSERSLDQIARAISEPITINMPPLISPQTDKAAAIANLIAIQLREIQPQLLDEITIQLLQIINTAKQRQP